MEDVVRKAIIDSLKKGGKTKDTVTVIRNGKPNDATVHIQERIKELRESNIGEFSMLARGNTQNDTYFNHPCVRAGKARKKSWKYTSCTAYVTFTLVTKYPGYLGIIERLKDSHTGHDPSECVDKHKSPIDPELKQLIRKWLKIGVRPENVWTLAIQWAEERGHLDVHDRRYYVTPQDVKNIRDCLLRETRMDKNDAVSVEKLLTTEYKEETVFYQNYEKNRKPFIAVLQSDSMKENMKKYGQSTVFMDATNSVNQYSFPLYTLLVKDEFGRGKPVAHIIVSDESQDTLILALTKLRAANPEVIPR